MTKEEQDYMDDKLEEDRLWAQREREMGDDYYTDCYDGWGDTDINHEDEDDLFIGPLEAPQEFIGPLYVDDLPF